MAQERITERPNLPGLIDLSSTKDNIKEVNTAFSRGEKGRYTGFHNVFGKAKASNPGSLLTEHWRFLRLAFCREVELV